MEARPQQQPVPNFAPEERFEAAFMLGEECVIIMKVAYAEVARQEPLRGRDS